MAKADRISALVLFAVGAYWLMETIQLLRASPLREPGENVVPLVVSVALMVCSVWLFVISAPKKEEKEGRLFSNRARIALLLGLMVVYLALVPVFGFACSTALFLLLMLTVVEKYSWWKSLLLAAGVTTSLFLVFRLSLYLPLPPGPWGF